MGLINALGIEEELLKKHITEKEAMQIMAISKVMRPIPASLLESWFNDTSQFLTAIDSVQINEREEA